MEVRPAGTPRAGPGHRSPTGHPRGGHQPGHLVSSARQTTPGWDAIDADPYAIDARYYDLVHEGRFHDTGLWLSFAGRTDRPVLEVGTGTGRIALELARAGHAVTGIDPSPAMLAIARQAADDDALDVELIEGRAEELLLPPDHYGLALVPADVFLYCQDRDEQVSLLSALARALHFNGTLVVDLAGPALWLDPSTNGEPLLTWSGETEAGERLEAWHVHEDDLAEQTRWLRVAYELVGADGVVRRQVTQHHLRYVYRFEAEYLLQQAGLAVADVYGDYELGPLTNDSERMIVVARRQAG